MEALPPEILDPIICSLCTDGGRTSCMLREVSRYMCSLVEPYRFQNVFILGPRKMGRFLQELERASVEVRCVRHLFISDQVPITAGDLPNHENPSLLLKVLHAFKPKDPWDKSERSRILWIHKTLSRICNICAPSLLSLAVSFGPTEEPQPHWTWGTHQFPLLREFTFIYFDRKQQSGLPNIDYANMPMLETLWISALPRLGALDMLEFNTQLTYSNGIRKRRVPRLVFEVGPDSWMESFVNNYYRLYLDTPRTDSHSWIFDTVEHHAIMPDRDYQIGIIYAIGRTSAIRRKGEMRGHEGVHLPGNLIVRYKDQMPDETVWRDRWLKRIEIDAHRKC